MNRTPEEQMAEEQLTAKIRGSDETALSMLGSIERWVKKGDHRTAINMLAQVTPILVKSMEATHTLRDMRQPNMRIDPIKSEGRDARPHFTTADFSPIRPYTEQPEMSGWYVIGYLNDKIGKMHQNPSFDTITQMSMFWWSDGKWYAGEDQRGIALTPNEAQFYWFGLNHDPAANRALTLDNVLTALQGGRHDG